MRPVRAIARLLVLVAAALSAACGQLLFTVANAPSLLTTSRRAVDVSYGQDARQRLDVYAPPNARNLPVVVFWYGGGWTHGLKSDYRFVGAALAKRGFVAVLPDYRLFPAVRFPVLLDDAAQAVTWTQQHAAEYGGDPHRMVLMGHSAGAYMAAFLAVDPVILTRAGAKPEWIRGLVGLSGPYALAPNTEVLNTIFAAPYTAKDWQPVNFVTQESPPALLIHGLDDTLVYPGHAEKMRDALARDGVRVELELLPHRGHADTVAAITPVARFKGPVLDDSVRFIESVTSSSSASPISSSRPSSSPQPLTP